uniref:Sushi domain-containing protein n=1 Tax=Gopherus agassizii TaxID=38772 RepID=A0A452HB71_9SAUR
MLFCFCSAIQCGRIENGKIVDKVEEKTTFRCDHGYKSENGINETTCTAEGWSPVPICIVQECSHPPDIDLAEIVSGEKAEYQEGDVVQYRCYPGYTLAGSERITCNGEKWTPPPKCFGTGEKCGRPPTIENGDITTLSLKEYAFGSSVEYRCQHYYIIEGDRKSYCYNGIWTKVPVCLGKKNIQ